MVSRQDIRDINGWMNGSNDADNEGLIDAMDRLEDIYEQANEMGVKPSNHPDFAAAQEDVKQAINGILHASNDAVDRTDTLKLEDGTTVTLPNAALSRSNSSSLPTAPKTN